MQLSMPINLNDLEEFDSLEDLQKTGVSTFDGTNLLRP